MSRSARAFTAGSFELEGRLLLAVGPASTPTDPPTVQFEAALNNRMGQPMQVVTQQAGEATVTLSRSEFAGTQVLRGKGGAYQGTEPLMSPDTTGTLQVEVTTGPSGPYVGVNVGAVDQLVTFADGQSQATLTVPILAGAPNPGEVDVSLSIKPIPPMIIGPPVLDLRILASDPTAPPKVVSVDYTKQGLFLGFNKPMDPAGASDVNNYAVYVTRGYAKTAQIQTAQYDPATQSVILVPKRPNSMPSGFVFTTLTQIQTARTSARRGHQSNVAGSLTDLQGNPIDASTTPGRVLLRDVFTPPAVGGDGIAL